MAGLCVVAIAAAGFAVGRPAFIIPALGAFVVLDWTLLAVTGGLRRSRFALRLALAPGAHPTTGETITLQATLEARRGTPELLVLPVLPERLTLAEPGAALIRLERDRPLTIGFGVRPRAPGRCVVPGVLVRATSPFRLFTRTLLLIDRFEIDVPPDIAVTGSRRTARFHTPLPRAGALRRQTLVGAGTDFRELRPYRYPEPIKRVDWKATARRRELIIREVESQRDYTVAIMLDASPDMVRDRHGRSPYAQALPFVSRLAAIAVEHGVRVQLVGYDDALVLDTRCDGGIPALQRLLAALVALPHLAMERRAIQNRDQADRAATRFHERVVGRWRGHDRTEPLDRFLASYLPERPQAQRVATYLADFAPHLIETLGERCPNCGASRFADEPQCPACAGMIDDQLAPRARCLAERLERAILRNRGRGTLVVVSTLRGGEAHPQIADLLALACAHHHTVHVVVPGWEAISDFDHLRPGAMGHLPATVEVLRHVERLAEATRVRGFARKLEAEGITVHRLDDAVSLDDVVAALVQEVLVPV